MHELRLVGVHEGGRHVLLTDPSGQNYRLPLDDALRAAALRDRPRLGQIQIEIEGGLRPAEVQSLIRRGLSAEEVAARAGWSVEKVRRYEGPVLAEREYVVTKAQSVPLGSSVTRSTLGERVAARLRDRGVERESLRWDSARGDDGLWTVTVTFPAGGRERSATWFFDHVGRAVSPRNDEARWLSQEDAAGPIPAPHVATSANRASTVYDVEAEGGVSAAPRHRAPGEPIDLMAAMREHSARGRRGRRRGPSATPGEDEPRVDALPLAEFARNPDDAPPPPVAREDLPDSARIGEPDGWADEPDPTPATTPPTSRPHEEHGREHPRERARSVPSALATGTTHPVASRSPGRRGRTSVPSWDDIMFGTRTRGSEAD